MAEAVHSVVAERIRRPIPAGLSVLPGSLPIVSFGDPNVAAVATLSLNPSWIELEARRGGWLDGPRRRVASLVSLSIDDPRELDDEQVAQVVAECNAYFTGGNWYRAWFHWLESLLAGSRAGSYMDGSACHLDLVQWATKPAQGKLPAEVWDRLVQDDHEFLRWQLLTSNVSVVLMNGASVVRWVEQAGLLTDVEQDQLSYQSKTRRRTMRLYRGIAEGVLFLGWNIPLDRAISRDGRERLIGWVAQRLAERSAAPGRDGAGQAGSSVNLDDGFVPAGTIVEDVGDLERVLLHWLSASSQATVGDIGMFGGSPGIIVRAGSDQFVLNRDTKRAAVEAFLAAAAGGAANLSWHVTANRRGTINRVSYRRDDAATPGWYAYLRETVTEPRDLR